MALKINASTMLERCELRVDSQGVTFLQTVFGGAARRFAFGQIDAVLMSPGGELSLQVGLETFRIQTNPQRKNDAQVIATLVQQLQALDAPPNDRPPLAPTPATPS